MAKTIFVVQAASPFVRVAAWAVVAALVAAVAYALHRWAKWPWIVSAPAGVVAYVILGMVVIYGRLWWTWRS